MKSRKTILFLQVTSPGAYPPLIHACQIAADAGWRVVVLASPRQGQTLEFPNYPGVEFFSLRERDSFDVSKLHYLSYCWNAIKLALKVRPHVIYSSDPLGALPGVLTKLLANAGLVYHEHDSPSSNEDLALLLRKARRLAIRYAGAVVFPNGDRADASQKELGFSKSKLFVVWNVPTLAEIDISEKQKSDVLTLYYHGSITPERLPESVVEAVARFEGKVRLDVAGYEAPIAIGYTSDLSKRWNTENYEVIRILGQFPRSDLLQEAARKDIGLALMPKVTNDINLRHMAGASNKPFDYLAVGMLLIVSDLPDWRRLYVDSDVAVAINPQNVNEIVEVIHWCLINREEIARKGRVGRTLIRKKWNYEAQFLPVLKWMEDQALQ